MKTFVQLLNKLANKKRLLEVILLELGLFFVKLLIFALWKENFVSQVFDIWWLGRKSAEISQKSLEKGILTLILTLIKYLRVFQKNLKKNLQ